MASPMVRGGLECSSSGRGVLRIVAPPRSRRVSALSFPIASSPVFRSASIQPAPNADYLRQPPHGRRAGKLRHQPLRVAQLDAVSMPKSADDFEAYVNALNEAWAIPEVIEFGIGQGGLPTVLLTHPQTGMKLVVYLYGATIAQWLKSDGTATFHDGPEELFQIGMPLRTGVSLHFPQHREGVLPLHGFADSMMWEVVGAGIENFEMLAQMSGWWEWLQESGALDPQLLEEAEESEEAAEKVRALLASRPAPDNLVDSDMAPCITLRLRDTPETRKMWPHSFELEYKITLETQGQLTEEEWRDIRRSRGMTDEQEAADEAADEAEEERLMEALLGEEDEEGEQEGGEGEAEGEEETSAFAGRRENEGGDGEEGAEELSPPEASRKKRGRPPKQAAVAGEAAGAQGAEEGEVEEEGEEERAGLAEDEEEEQGEDAGAVGPEPFKPTVQIRQEFWVRNKDEPGSAPMRFSLGSLARFVTLQQPDCGDWIKVLGLGGSQTFDYTEDPRYPRLDMCDDDFVHFRGEPIDVTYIGAADATLYLCPGNRTHFEFIQRAGFNDMFVQHPGLDAVPEYDRVATIGTGYVASTKILPAGEQWHAESIIRFHDRYFPPPVFGDDSMPPLPPIPKDLLTEEGGEGEDLYEGMTGESTEEAGLPEQEE
ncbi:hypothetical protein Agub_g937 [Astrephomene gubernaculifera]|uniref:Uncharacterized protein n=1 Tax=Astrephomene gubernaculifera TaxID=47775 RepID=A0AAD3HGW3_9CHLO|nr:hypothetical protein Agub_g937 [Astrephomene gubernaculifera]